MKITHVKCPECGGALQIPNGAEWANCQYCGSQVHIAYDKQQAANDPNAVLVDSHFKDPKTYVTVIAGSVAAILALVGVVFLVGTTVSKPEPTPVVINQINEDNDNDNDNNNVMTRTEPMNYEEELRQQVQKGNLTEEEYRKMMAQEKNQNAEIVANPNLPVLDDNADSGPVTVTCLDQTRIFTVEELSAISADISNNPTGENANLFFWYMQNDATFDFGEIPGYGDRFQCRIVSLNYDEGQYDQYGLDMTSGQRERGITFMAKHALPVMFPMTDHGGDTANLIWAGCLADCSLNNKEGQYELYGLIPSSVRRNAKQIVKYNHSGVDKFRTSTAKFWPISSIEMFGETSPDFLGKGKQYDYFKLIGCTSGDEIASSHFGPVATAVSQPWMTRTGGDALKEAKSIKCIYNQEQDIWLRDTYGIVGGTGIGGSSALPDWARIIVPCFTL